jgi:hypothetical protein
MKANKVVEIMRTGDFTIAYHDNDGGCFYKGKHKYEDLPDDADYDFDVYGQSGYLPEAVELLVRALGGKSESV